MTAPRWPAPGTTYGPDAESLNVLRDVLRAWPGRGSWDASIGGFPENRTGAWRPDDVKDGDTWRLVRDTWSFGRDTQPAEAARTVVVRTWEFAWSDDGGATWRVCVRDTERDAAWSRVDQMRPDWLAGPVVPVERALPLPVEPAAVVGTVVGGDS